MRRATLLVFGILLMATATFGQSSAGDSQTLQELLKEVKELRQDLRTSLASMQRGQLLLFRMQTEQAAVAQAQQRVDAANTSLERAQRMRRGIENELKFETDRDTEEATPNPVERQRLEEQLPRIKAQLDNAQALEQQAQSNVMTAKDQLQNEQGKLDGLQGELDQVDHNLANLAKQPGN